MARMLFLLLSGCDSLKDMLEGYDTATEPDPMVRVEAACGSESCDALTLTASNDRSDAVTYTWVAEDGTASTGDTLEVAVNPTRPTLALTLEVDWDDGLEADFTVDARLDPVEDPDPRVVIDAVWLLTSAQGGRCRFHHHAVAIDGPDGLSGCITGSSAAGFTYSTTGTSPCGFNVTPGQPCVRVTKAPDAATNPPVTLGQAGPGAVFRNVTASGYFSGSTSAAFGMDIFPTATSGWVHHEKYDAAGNPVPSATTGFYPHPLTCPSGTNL